MVVIDTDVLLLACPLSLTLLAPCHLVRLRVSPCQFVGLTARAYGPFRLQRGCKLICLLHLALFLIPLMIECQQPPQRLAPGRL